MIVGSAVRFTLPEYDRLQKASKAESDLATWEEQTQITEEGIDARDQARKNVIDAVDRWRSHTAQLLHNALQRDAEIQSEIAGADTEIGQKNRTGNLLVGKFADVPLPAAPVGDFKLYFDDIDLDDLWFAVTWSGS